MDKYNQVMFFWKTTGPKEPMVEETPIYNYLLKKTLFVFWVEVVYDKSQSRRECLQDRDVVQASMWPSRGSQPFIIGSH